MLSTFFSVPKLYQLPGRKFTLSQPKPGHAAERELPSRLCNQGLGAESSLWFWCLWAESGSIYLGGLWVVTPPSAASSAKAEGSKAGQPSVNLLAKVCRCLEAKQEAIYIYLMIWETVIFTSHSVHAYLESESFLRTVIAH